jgi:peptidoglycan/LPS O-acetylase OafA/YrhL
MHRGKKGRLRELDGLRAISVLLVIVGHCIIHTVSLSSGDIYKLGEGAGSIGVFIFFVISGYIITKLFIKENKLTGDISISSFYLRRVFRILPAFYFFLVVVFLLTLSGTIHTPFVEILLAGAFFTNLLPHVSWYLVHTWSLATEEQYYIFFPICFYLGWRFLGRRFILLLWLSIFLIWGLWSCPLKQSHLVC